MLTFGSLFAGIGGFDLGFEGAGLRCVWQVEIDEFCRRVLAKHWPNVRRWDDVRTFPQGEASEWACDVICGGFPCQDISLAGKGAGIGGSRSGLWAEFARVVRVVRPRIVVVENSPALANRGLAVVLRDLADMGFDAEWAVLPASAFGACHIRARMFVVAHRHGAGRNERAGKVFDGRRRPEPPDGRHAADPDRPGLAVREKQILLVQQPAPVGSGWWAAEPGVVRVAHGVPRRVDRISGLGNAVVPQVAEWIGRRLVEVAGFERTGEPLPGGAT